MLDILCIGDVLIDIFLDIPKDNPHFGIDKDKNKLFIDYGYKISLNNYIKEIGGDASNTAVGISRIGKNVGLCAEIGKDEFSVFILNKLTNEKINTSLINQDVEKKTSFSVCLNYSGERTLLVEHVQRKHLFDFDNSSARFIYLTSLGNEWEFAYEKTLDFVKKTESKLAFSPGTLQIDGKNRIVDELIQTSNYLFLNKQEAEKILYGSVNNSEIKKILYGLRAFGAKNIIITDAESGSYLYDESDKIYHLNIVNVEVVEKTGAGDAYTSGFLAAILDNKDSKTAMIWGAINSASVVTKVGAQEGLLHKDQIESKLMSLGDFYPQEIS